MNIIHRATPCWYGMPLPDGRVNCELIWFELQTTASLPLGTDGLCVATDKPVVFVIINALIIW